MAIYLDEKQAVLGFGCFAAFMHALWVILIFAGSAQKFLDWIFGLHMVNTAVTVTGINITTAVMLIAVTFIFGAVFGGLFAKIWNWAGKQKF
jgi:hypothetical protein